MGLRGVGRLRFGITDFYVLTPSGYQGLGYRDTWFAILEAISAYL